VSLLSLFPVSERAICSGLIFIAPFSVNSIAQSNNIRKARWSPATALWRGLRMPIKGMATSCGRHLRIHGVNSRQEVVLHFGGADGGGEGTSRFLTIVNLLRNITQCLGGSGPLGPVTGLNKWLGVKFSKM
jgi:hypothetical protein